MRLTSLDVFRGIAIAGMIVVNKAGVAEDVYPALVHADWNGCTLADLVFPFFLFIVGVAMSFSLSKYTDSNNTEDESKNLLTSSRPVYGRILRRSVILFALGLLLNGFWNQGVWTFDWSSIRIMGVLQRISLAYLFACLTVLNLPRQAQWGLAGVLLVGYSLAMMFVPVPGYGAGVLTREGNLGAYIDRLVIGTAHLYKGDKFNFMGDPEGLFSSIGAVVSVLFGYFTGDWLRKQPVKTRTSVTLAVVGIGCLILGGIWDWIFPINKKLWTSSFVVFSTGWGLLLLAACYQLIEVQHKRRWGKPFEILGMNAIAIFVASVLAIKILVKTTIGTGEKAPNTYTWIYQHFFVPWAGTHNSSLIFALLTLLLWWAVAYLMYRRNWYIKV